MVKAFELQVLNSLLTTLTSALVVGLLVVFQPELRRGLLSLGEHKFLHMFAPSERGCEEEVGRAVRSLARDRHGALFAIERHNGLNHIARTGVEVDAEARAELMASIFFPGNPLHDGGVIIRGDRIVAASTIFPVTERTDLSTRLGTRHRAAIGLAEESDAIVVIVSEETGRVSVVVDGELQYVDPPESVVGVIHELMERPVESAAQEPQEDDAEGEDDDDDRPAEGDEANEEAEAA